MTRRDLYKDLITRMDAAMDAGYYLETAWYASALLESRLLSLLQSSGGIPRSKKGVSRGQPIRTLGAKLSELKDRVKTHEVLKQVDFSAIEDWIEQRNELMHEMAEQTKSLAAIDNDAKNLARASAQIVRGTASVAMRLKKHVKRQSKQSSVQ